MFGASDRLRIDPELSRDCLDAQALAEEQVEDGLLLLAEEVPGKIGGVERLWGWRHRPRHGEVSRVRPMRDRESGSFESFVNDGAGDDREPGRQRRATRIEGPKKFAFLAQKTDVDVLYAVVDVRRGSAAPLKRTPDGSVNHPGRDSHELPPRVRFTGDAAGEIKRTFMWIGRCHEVRERKGFEKTAEWRGC